MGHYARVCRSKFRSTVASLQEAGKADDLDGDRILVVESGEVSVDDDKRKNRPKAIFSIDGCDVCLMVDIGSKCTIIPKCLFYEKWDNKQRLPK